MLALCCVCLKTSATSKKVGEIDENNTTLYSKLTACVPDVNWNSDWSICTDCTVHLKNAYEFRELCLKSDAIRCEKSVDSYIELFVKNESYASDHSDGETKEEQTNEVTFNCFHCNQSFDSKTPLVEHLKQSHDAKRKRKARVTEFACEDCAGIFKTSKKLIEHAMEAHSKPRNAIKPFKCDKCDGRFASSSNLVQHTKYHVGLRTNMCTYCGKGFITSSDLINHEKQHLNRREYTCKHCSKRFNTHKDLRSHTIIKHKDPSTWNYHCSLCDKHFHIKPNYDSHMRRHSGEKRFTCHLCAKSFVTKDEQRKHMTSHTNVRAFQCAECGKEYKDKRVLDVHMAKIHAIGTAKIPQRIRKHLCNVCPKAFYDKNKLVRHLYTHSGERPFACDLCDKRFTDKSYVKYHLKTAHGVHQNGDSSSL